MYFNIYIAFDFIHKVKLKLIVGADNTDMTKMNSFVEELIKKIIHGRKHGWMMRLSEKY